MQYSSPIKTITSGFNNALKLITDLERDNKAPAKLGFELVFPLSN